MTVATDLVKWIPGTGDIESKFWVVGEAPGQHEDEQGVPFVGRSGQLLRKELAEAGIDPDEIYITNIVKWRPENNRTPNQDEIEECIPTLIEELQEGKPTHILAVGNTSFQTLTNSNLGVTLYRGFWTQLSERFEHTAFVLPCFHPAFVLRQQKKLELFRKDINEFASARNSRTTKV